MLRLIPLMIGIKRTAAKESISVDRLGLSNEGVNVVGNLKTQCLIKRKPHAFGTWTGEFSTVRFFIATGHDLMDSGGAC